MEAHAIALKNPFDAARSAFDALPIESSHGLRQRIGEFVATGSYDAAVEGVTRATKVAVPKRQAEELAVDGALADARAMAPVDLARRRPDRRGPLRSRRAAARRQPGAPADHHPEAPIGVPMPVTRF